MTQTAFQQPQNKNSGPTFRKKMPKILMDRVHRSHRVRRLIASHFSSALHSSTRKTRKKKTSRRQAEMPRTLCSSSQDKSMSRHDPGNPHTVQSAEKAANLPNSARHPPSAGWARRLPKCVLGARLAPTLDVSCRRRQGNVFSRHISGGHSLSLASGSLALVADERNATEGSAVQIRPSTATEISVEKSKSRVDCPSDNNPRTWQCHQPGSRRTLIPADE